MRRRAYRPEGGTARRRRPLHPAVVLRTPRGGRGRRGDNRHGAVDMARAASELADKAAQMRTLVGQFRY